MLQSRPSPQAFLIAFTSDFLPRLLYQYKFDNELHGYVNFTLAHAPLNYTEYSMCRYGLLIVIGTQISFISCHSGKILKKLHNCCFQFDRPEHRCDQRAASLVFYCSHVLLLHINCTDRSAVTLSFIYLFRRYKAFRDNNGNYTLFYWELLAVRLGFIIAFEVRTELLCLSLPMCFPPPVSDILMPTFYSFFISHPHFSVIFLSAYLNYCPLSVLFFHHVYITTLYCIKLAIYHVSCSFLHVFVIFFFTGPLLLSCLSSAAHNLFISSSFFSSYFLLLQSIYIVWNL